MVRESVRTQSGLTSLGWRSSIVGERRSKEGSFVGVRGPTYGKHDPYGKHDHMAFAMKNSKPVYFQVMVSWGAQR